MTVAQARTILLRYVGPVAETSNGTFLSALNQLRERLFTTGRWKGLILEVEVTPVNNVVTLPNTCEAVLGAQVDDRPVVVFGSMHEFLPNGPGEVTEERFRSTLALVDNGDYTYKIMGGTDNVESVRLRCKRRYADLTGDSDIVYPDNVGALKLGLMSLAYEDSGDFEKAELYFSKCLALLNDELTEARGGAIPVFQQSPHGFGVGNKLRRLY